MRKASLHKFLTQGFSTFLRRRRVKRHFERRPLLESLVGAKVPAPLAGIAAGAATGIADAHALGQALLTAASDEPAAALARLQSQADGLDAAEAARRLVQDGPNEVAHEPPLPAWLHLWHCYLNPFNVLLTVLALLSFLSADSKATAVIAVFGPISSLFDIATFGVLWWVFAANSVALQGLFQTGWFVESLLTQTLVVHMLRTPKLPFMQSRAAAPLLVMTLTIMAIGLWLPLSPLAGRFRLQALPAAFYGWLALMLLAYSSLTTVMKRSYIRRFGWQ